MMMSCAKHTAYWQLIVPGGFLVGDDYHENWPEVQQAAQDFAARLGKQLQIDGPKWFLGKDR